MKYLNSARAAGDNIVTKRYAVTLTGSYTAGGAIGVAGEVLNFTTPSNAGYAARTKLVSPPAAKLAANTDFTVICPGGFTGQIEQNATLPTAANFILRLFGGGSGNAAPAELTTATYASQAPALAASPVVVEVKVLQKAN